MHRVYTLQFSYLGVCWFSIVFASQLCCPFESRYSSIVQTRKSLSRVHLALETEALPKGRPARNIEQFRLAYSGCPQTATTCPCPSLAASTPDIRLCWSEVFASKSIWSTCSFIMYPRADARIGTVWRVLFGMLGTKPSCSSRSSTT